MIRAFAALTVIAFATVPAWSETLRFAGEAMGTTYNITAIDKTDKLSGTDVQAAIDAALADVNAAMSNWDPNSEISRFNAIESTEPIEISPELMVVMQASNDVHTASMGQFDVTLGPLIQLWGFGTRNAESPVPADDEIAAARAVVGQSKLLSFTDTTMAKARSDTNVWLAAIAKGYGVDRIAVALEGFGMTDYLVEIGGDLVVSGFNPDGNPWRIGVEKPDAGGRQIEEIVAVTNVGMATSGDYRNYFEENGVRYSHIIDAETGRPITHTTASVTVLADTAMRADAWATALLVLGAERGMPIAEEQNLAVLFISRDPSLSELEFMTTASERFIAMQAEE